MKQAAASVQVFLQCKGADSVFDTLFARANDVRAEFDLEEICTPRQRRPPKRFTGPRPGCYIDNLVTGTAYLCNNACYWLKLIDITITIASHS